MPPGPVTVPRSKLVEPARIGLEAARILRKQNAQVTAFVRPTSTREALDDIGVQVVIGDTSERTSINKILAGETYDTVITSLGGAREEPKRVDFGGNKNAVDTATDKDMIGVTAF